MIAPIVVHRQNGVVHVGVTLGWVGGEERALYADVITWQVDTLLQIEYHPLLAWVPSDGDDLKPPEIKAAVDLWTEEMGRRADDALALLLKLDAKMHEVTERRKHFEALREAGS